MDLGLLTMSSGVKEGPAGLDPMQDVHKGSQM